VLCGAVAGHLKTFLARQRERGRLVPRFVERELSAFLDCGILARGFLRVHRHELLRCSEIRRHEGKDQCHQYHGLCQHGLWPVRGD
jgi:hypothetical protein